MTLTIWEIALALAGCAVLLGAACVLLYRRSRPVFPVYCAHCWKEFRRTTIVTYVQHGLQWAICQDCVTYYWKFEAPERLPSDGTKASASSAAGGNGAE